MAELFNRDFAINIGGVSIESGNVDGRAVPILRVEFAVEHTLKKEPNTASVTITNLREDTRALLSRRGIATVVEAGYVGRRSVIFEGTLDFGATERDGTDWISTFESTDGGAAMRAARINETFKAGIDVRDVIAKAADQLGVALGNVLEATANGNVKGAIDAFKNGITMSGPAVPQFDRIMRSMGYDWSVQNGALQILEPGDVLDDGELILLKRGTGLVGSPQPGDDGAIVVRTLMLPSLIPGRRIKVESRLVDGFFRIERSSFSGDTRSTEFNVELECRPL